MGAFDHPGWLWGLSLIVLTMAIHATTVVMLAFAAVRIRVRLETRGLKMWNLIAILICVIGVIGLLLAVLHGIRVRDLGSGLFVAWRSELAHGRFALFAQLDEHARRIRADAATTLADNGRAGGRRRDAAVRCEHGVPFLGDAGVLVDAHRAREPQQTLTRVLTFRCPAALGSGNIRAGLRLVTFLIIHCNARGTGGTRSPSVLVPVMTTTEAVVPARSLILSGTLSIRTATGMRCASRIHSKVGLTEGNSSKPVLPFCCAIPQPMLSTLPSKGMSG